MTGPAKDTENNGTAEERSAGSADGIDEQRATVASLDRTTVIGTPGPSGRTGALFRARALTVDGEGITFAHEGMWTAGGRAIDTAELLVPGGWFAVVPVDDPVDDPMEVRVEYGRRFPDGEVVPAPSGYVDDPRWLTCAGQPVTWVQRTVTYSGWTEVS